MKNILKALALILSVNTAFAITPENGWWWNPAKSGTGYNIEAQNNTVFVATFVYDNAGNPVWYSGSGDLNANSMVTLNLLRSEGGPCLGCTYAAPQSSSTGQQVTLRFESEMTGTVSLNGSAYPIERFNFNYGSGAQNLLGIWSIAITAPPGMLGSSDTIGFNSVSSDSKNAIGFRVSDISAPVVAKLLEGGKNYLAITPVSASEEQVLFFSFQGLNQIIGLSALVRANASADEIFYAIDNYSVLTRGFRFMPPPINTTKTASTKRVSSRNNQVHIQSMLNELDKVAAIIQAKGFTLKLPLE